MATQTPPPLTQEEKIAGKFFLTFVVGIALGWILFHRAPQKVEPTPVAVCPESQIVETDKNLDKWDMLKRTDDSIFVHSAGIIAACERQDAVAAKIHADAITDGLKQRDEVVKALGY